VSGDAGSNAIFGLAYINRHAVEVAENVHTDLVNQLFDGVFSEFEVGSQRISESLYYRPSEVT
jgi:hypothetical protein